MNFHEHVRAARAAAVTILLPLVGCAEAPPPASPPPATDSAPAPSASAAAPPAGKVVTFAKYGIQGSLAEDAEMDADRYGELKGKSGLHVTVKAPGAGDYDTAAQTEKDVVTSFSAKNVKTETLADGWLLTFDTTNLADATEKRFQVTARRTIGGKPYACFGNEPSPALRAEAVAFCKSLTAK